jgi:hypothetical protein
LIAFTGTAHALSNTQLNTLPSGDNLVIDSVNITGVAPVTAEHLQAVLSQKIGEKISIIGVKYDLEAIHHWYEKNVPVDVDAWSGLELIASRVTVIPDVEKLSSGRAMITYDVKEWFPTRN